jgi:hypothetical protein
MANPVDPCSGDPIQKQQIKGFPDGVRVSPKVPSCEELTLIIDGHPSQIDCELLVAGTITITTLGGSVQEPLIDDVKVFDAVEFTLCVNV